MNKYNPKISEQKQDLFDKIQNRAYEIAKKKKMDFVPRELSLFVLMEHSEKLIRKIDDTGADAICFYQELYTKYEQIDFTAAQTNILPGDEWKALIETNDITPADKINVMPDINFLTAFAKNLALPGRHSNEHDIWLTFQETISDVYSLPKEERKIYTTDIMNKYLINPDTRNLYLHESYQLKLENNADDILKSVEDLDKEIEELKAEPDAEVEKKKWKWPISLKFNWK